MDNVQVPQFKVWFNHNKNFFFDEEHEKGWELCININNEVIIISPNSGRVLTVDNVTICRFTGKFIKDVPIYEHDILQWHELIHEVVKYNGDYGYFEGEDFKPLFLMHLNKYKLIGSSLENPELLEVKNGI